MRMTTNPSLNIHHTTWMYQRLVIVRIITQWAKSGKITEKSSLKECIFDNMALYFECH